MHSFGNRFHEASIGSFFYCRIGGEICRMKKSGVHPLWYEELYIIFYKTHDKRGYSSHSTGFLDLYTPQNAKNPHSVDNTVDNVDNPLWISHTVFVNSGYA